jgi:thiol-disulfide isomerase/thioredoxin
MLSRLARLALLFSVSLIATAPAWAQAGWKSFSTPGGQAPQSLVLHDLSGKQVDLASLKGQVVLVNFWATWCEPCKDEMPSLDRVHQKLATRGLRVIGVNFGEGKPRIEQFLKSVPVGFPLLRDDDLAVSKAWRVRVLPATFLVDRKGMLRYQLVGEADWDDPALQAPILELLK